MESLRSNLAEKSYFLSESVVYRPGPGVRVFAESGRYLLKTVEGPEEFLMAAKLRFSVFHGEMAGIKADIGMDTDRFDQNADVLIIIDKKTDEIVGTYRIRCSNFTKEFYSSDEFTLQAFLERPGTKLELSRACVHLNHRNGACISLLWRGIYQYIVAMNASELFGCSSVCQVSVSDIGRIQRHFIEKNIIYDELDIFPKPEYYMDAANLNTNEGHDHGAGDVTKVIPSLLHMYLKAGADIALIPAWDAYFKCFDFFTVLRTDRLSPLFVRVFGS